jgi:hypothetical protein
MLHIQDSHLTEEVSRTPQHGPLAIFGDVLSWLPIGGKQRDVATVKKHNDGVILFGFVPGSAKAIETRHRTEGASLTPQVAQPRQVQRSRNSFGLPQTTNLKHEVAVPGGQQLARLQHEGAMPGDRRAPHAGVSKEELGRATWTFLHTLAAQFPEKPTRSQQKDVKTMVMIPLLEHMPSSFDICVHFSELHVMHTLNNCPKMVQYVIIIVYIIIIIIVITNVISITFHSPWGPDRP